MFYVQHDNENIFLFKETFQHSKCLFIYFQPGLSDTTEDT